MALRLFVPSDFGIVPKLLKRALLLVFQHSKPRTDTAQTRSRPPCCRPVGDFLDVHQLSFHADIISKISQELYIAHRTTVERRVKCLLLMDFVLKRSNISRRE
jgi:hypothetical protein